MARLQHVHQSTGMTVDSHSIINWNVKLSAALCDTMLCHGVAAPHIHNGTPF